MDANPDGSIHAEVWSDPIGDPLLGQFCPVCKQAAGLIQVIVVGSGDQLIAARRIFVCGVCRFTADIGPVDITTMQAELLERAKRIG